MGVAFGIAAYSALLDLPRRQFALTTGLCFTG